MKEASLGKITRKYFFKVLIWFLVIDLIFGAIALGVFVSKIDENSSSFIDFVVPFNNLVTTLIIVNVVACILSALLATRKIKKKFIINEDNKKKVFRNVAIILCIMTVLLIGAHAAIKGTIFKEAWKGMDITEQEAKEKLKDIDEFAEELDIDIDEVDYAKKFFTLSDIYVVDGIVFAVMIAAEYLLIIKKEQKA